HRLVFTGFDNIQVYSTSVSDTGIVSGSIYGVGLSSFKKTFIYDLSNDHVQLTDVGIAESDPGTPATAAWRLAARYSGNGQWVGGQYTVNGHQYSAIWNVATHDFRPVGDVDQMLQVDQVSNDGRVALLHRPGPAVELVSVD